MNSSSAFLALHTSQLSYAGRMKVSEWTVGFSANWAMRICKLIPFRDWISFCENNKLHASMWSEVASCEATVPAISLSPHNAICFKVSYSRCIAPRIRSYALCIGWHTACLACVTDTETETWWHNIVISMIIPPRSFTRIFLTHSIITR